MQKSFVEQFEKRVSDFFIELGIQKNDKNFDFKIGVAVSGGADSVSLLLSLVHLFGKDSVFVITVNHNIRKKEETDADADFVERFCHSLGVFCETFVLERGLVQNLAETRKKGVEEAARYLRYQAFESFIKKHNLPYLCLAHNQNDQLETLLMRFFQGSGIDGGCGIVPKRGCYIRPLLKISRNDIEQYLLAQNMEWRTDLSNFDTHYLRNRIRRVVMPFLDENVSGWKSAVLIGNEKNQYDDDCISMLCVPKWEKKSSSRILMASCDFYSLSPALQRRVIYSGLSLLAVDFRYPYKLVRSIFSWNDGGAHEQTCSGVVIKTDGQILEITTNVEKKNPICEYAVVSNVSDVTNSSSHCFFYDYDFFVEKKSDKFMLFVRTEYEEQAVCYVSLPFVIRSFQIGDVIREKNNGYKEINDIFASWHVPADSRFSIPLVYDMHKNEIIAILGAFGGFSNWILAENKI